jgi:anaerobic magnesium-protoporphyrin IX monomethyl ester cyclase
MKSLKVLLIQPSYRDCVQCLFSIYNTDEGIGLKPLLGILYIATAIKEMTSCSVRVMDCQLCDIHHDNILDYVTEDYDVIGVSAWTDYWFQGASIAKRLKRQFPMSHIVIGGPHANIYPKEILSLDFVDSIIMGDGEIPMVELLNELAVRGIIKKEIPGVYVSGRDYEGYTPYVHKNLDSLPIPDRTLLPLERYTSVLSSKDYVTTMITSRGCPYGCVYCKLEFQRPVRRSAANVVKEFEIINKLGIKEVEIYDDTFNWSHKRTAEICQGLIRKKIKMRWAIRERVDRVREDILDLLRRAGCYRIHIGVETGNDIVMEAIKKRITVQQARKAIGLVKKFKFTVLSYFMYGLPQETIVEARDTLRLALEMNTDYAEFSIMIPYPGTEAYREALLEGVIPYDYWLEYTKNPVPAFEIPYVYEKFMSKNQLVEIRDLSVRKFYFRPSYVLRELWRVRSCREFVRKFKMGLGLLKLLVGKFVR